MGEELLPERNSNYKSRASWEYLGPSTVSWVIKVEQISQGGVADLKKYLRARVLLSPLGKARLPSVTEDSGYLLSTAFHKLSHELRASHIISINPPNSPETERIHERPTLQRWKLRLKSGELCCSESQNMSYHLTPHSCSQFLELCSGHCLSTPKVQGLRAIKTVVHCHLVLTWARHPAPRSLVTSFILLSHL